MQSSRFASLYVGDLSPDVTEEDLIHKFSLTVPVVSVHLCRNSITGKSMCYAFINFDSPLTASNAMASLNHTDLKGKAMRIMWCQRDHNRTGFGDLYNSITGSCLEQIFCPFGPLLSCNFVEESGCSKSFGFVQLDLVAKPRLNLLREAFKELYKEVAGRFIKGSIFTTKRESNPRAPRRLIQLNPKESALSKYLGRISCNHRSAIEKMFPKNYTLAEQAIRRS